MPEYSTFGGTILPPDLQSRVEAQLDSDERLLWVGQPGNRRVFLRSLPLVLFGAVFAGFSLFWIGMAASIMFAANQQGGFPLFGLFMPCFGLPFLLAGLAIMFSPLWLKRMGRKTCYAVTNKRAFIVQPHWFGGINVRSFDDAALSEMRRTEFDDGSGDLIFEEYYTYGRKGHRQHHEIGFFGIDRVRDVEQLIRRVILDKNQE